MPDDPTVIELPADETVVTVRSLDKRELDVRLVPFNKTVNTRQGGEEFAPGSFADVPNDGMLLMGLEHEAGIGLGQDGLPKLTRRPQGRSVKVWEEPDGAYATFRVARTQGGDEILALADDRVIQGVSLEYDPGTTLSDRLSRNGRRVSRVTRAGGSASVPLAAALTYRPTYGEQATVIAVRSQEESMPESEVAPVRAEFSTEAVEALSAAFNQSQVSIIERLDAMERREVPALPVTRAEDIKEVPDKGLWVHAVLKGLSGEILPDQVMRALDDVITTDNLGVVPTAYISEILGVIDASRPFLSTTRRLTLPPAGMTISVPVINQRPEVGIQSPEKEEVASQKTLIGSETFSAVSIAGAADISIQLLKRSSPSYLGLFIELLAEAYAQFSEDVALDALANAAGGWGTGNALNPNSLSLGAAFVTSFDAIRRPPDTIWLSTQAVGEFIDAKASGTNAPLYSNITTSATAAGGVQGTIQGLRAVHVPTLDDHGAFALVGPSSGFAWTEDGTYTLQVDVPSKAGRDVGIVGMLWAMPLYPDAFSFYNVAS